jgi:hypothetical protein
MAITRVVDQSRNEHREVSIRLEWRRIPSNPHLFPPEWQITDPWNATSRNDGQLPYAERGGVAIPRTIHWCDRLDVLPPSISIDQRKSRCRQSQAFYTRFYGPSQTGQKPPRARLQASASAQNSQSAVLELSRLSGKAYPKRGPRGWRIVIAAVSASARQNRFEVELDICVSSCFHRGRGPVTLSLCSRQSISLTRLKCCYRRGRGPVLLRWVHGYGCCTTVGEAR